MNLETRINQLYEKQDGFSRADYELFEEFRNLLDLGEIRAAEKKDNRWQTNFWVKKGILLGFRLGKIEEFFWSKHKQFFDKNTYPEKRIDLESRIRIVPGGTSIRSGSFIAKSVTIMPPSYVNVGAYVDSGTMLDSHSLVGSCAQIGKNVHLSAAAMIGGVLEPIGNNPVIVEDDAFIGGNCGVYEGVIISRRAILASGVILTGSTKVFDAVNGCFLQHKSGEPLIIPEEAVLISGSRQLTEHPNISIYCPVIVKYRDKKTDGSVILEEWLR